MKTAWGARVGTLISSGRSAGDVDTVRSLARQTLVFWVWSALFLALWSLATPLWTAPDSVAHDIRAYGAAHGNLTPDPPEGDQVSARRASTRCRRG